MVELLHRGHNKDGFDCSKELLNNYLRNQAGQDVKRKLSACYVLAYGETKSVIGYYTLSNYGIPISSFSTQIRKRLPGTYTTIPTTLLGRLAIDKSRHGEGLGKILLIDALKRSWENSQIVASYAVVVDPLDEEAKSFYLHYGFTELPDSGKMFIPMRTLDELFTI
ncbi:MAG: GNAT family N-acetyltransferase [Bacteroidetes bacterium 41-46]|nr:MAG: GNAT family N-acetyltransferase [Bacteroidetes bacterium 41-46]